LAAALAARQPHVKMAAMHVHLVDGTYELFRSFYGAPPAQASGREVGAVRGLLASLASLLREPEVTHVGIAFDTVIESFRNELFAGYKTSEGIDPALWSQFPLAERAARALGLVTWPMVEFEADDALATAAVRAAADPRVRCVFVCTPDKDLAQVVGERIVLFDRRQRVALDATGVRAKYGVDPASIPDWLALVGDEADGIPGIAKWGQKSASTVLAHYRHLEAIPDAARDWQVQVRGAEALAAALAAQRADALLYRKLATLRRDVPLAAGVDDLRWRDVSDDFAPLCNELGLVGLRDRVPAPRP
jgi:5'-3' exonuclease